MGMNGTQIYDNFHGGNSRQVRAASDAIDNLAQGFQKELDAIEQLQQQMHSAWTGDSADEAYAGAGPLKTAFADSAAPLAATHGSLTSQSSAFEHSKTAVQPVPPAPEKPSGWSLGLKAAIPIAGPFMVANDVGSYQDGVNKHNAANENNVRVMDQYSTVTNSTRGTIPMDYKLLPLDGVNVGIRTDSAGSIEGRQISTPQSTGTTGSTGTYAPGAGPGSPLSGAPNVNTGQSTGSGPAGEIPAQGGAGNRIPGVTGPGGTPTSPTGSGPGFIPGPMGGTGGEDTTRGGRPGTSGGRGPNFGTPTGSGYGRGSAAGRLFDDETTGRGGSGAGKNLSSGKGIGSEGNLGRGGGAASENARGVGSGKGSGAGMSAAAAEEAAVARGAAGRGGAAGAGGPMAGGRGRGSDDEEHQRPDFLIEADPDSIFGTDERATPPVIGE
jgi:hypothetical protein